MGFIKGGVIMSLIDLFCTVNIVVSVIVIIIYLGLYFEWFWGGIIMKNAIVKTIYESVVVLSLLYVAMVFLCSL